MNLDMTFCSGTRCPRAGSCDRWMKNLEARMAVDPEFAKAVYEHPISVANFSAADGSQDDCRDYVSMEVKHEQEGKAGK